MTTTVADFLQFTDQPHPLNRLAKTEWTQEHEQIVGFASVSGAGAILTWNVSSLSAISGGSGASSG